MKNMTLAIAMFLMPLASNAATTICTVNTYASPQGFSVGYIVAVPTFDLSKAQYNMIVKKDGSVLPNVSYGDALYEGASKKYGDLTDAIFINVSRDQDSPDKGVNVLMASLSNDQKIAKFDISASSKSNDVFVQNIARGLSIGCQDELKQ